MKRHVHFLSLALAFGSLLAVVAASAGQFHVTVGGSSSGSGTLASPWSFSHALSHPAAVHPGDTIWVHGGTYSGQFDCYLRGTASNPIVVRNYNRERATIDIPLGSNNYGFHFTATAQYVWLWGLEVSSQCTDRETADPTGGGNTPTDMDLPTEAIASDGGPDLIPGIKVINCVVHDVAIGITFFDAVVGHEVYGNIIYNIGYKASNNGDGYGVYSHTGKGSQRSRVTYSNNIVGNGFSVMFHMYGSEGLTDSINLIQNVMFNPKVLYESTGYGATVALIRGVGAGTHGDSIIGNFCWATTEGTRINLGYMGTVQNSWVLGNRVISRTPTTEYGITLGQPGNVTVQGNTSVGSNGWAIDTYVTVEGGVDPSPAESVYPHNSFLHSYPTQGDSTYFLPNKYESGRGHVVSYNWGRQDSVSVNVSGRYAPGDSVYVYNAQNLYGDPPFVAVCRSNGTLRIPMNRSRWTMAVPSAWTAPPTSFPDFGVFVTTQTWARPAVPSPVRPSSGATGQNRVQVFEWAASPGATAYRLQVATDSLFGSPVFDSSSISGTTQQVGPLAKLTTYYWHVQSESGTVHSMFSPTWSFTTNNSAITGVENTNDRAGIPHDFTVEQNFPNPFNPSTRIAFGLPVSGHVVLRVYNMLGQEVTRLADGYLNAGYHTYEFSGAGLASGIYFYEVVADRYREVKRMILLR